MSTDIPTAFRFYSTEVEKLFRVADVAGDENRGHTHMITGPWLADEAGQARRGSLGVVMDDVMGYLISGITPEGQWAVSTEIHLDFIDDPPTDGSTLSAESWTLDRGPRTGLAGSRVTDSTGSLVASGSSRLQIVQVAENPTPTSDRPAKSSARRDATSIEELLGAVRKRDNGTASLELPTRGFLGNPLGNVHGGVLLCASELIGTSALPEETHFRTTSIHIAYLRPCPTDEHVTFMPQVLHHGRTFAQVQVIARIRDGKICTIATVTCSAVR